MKKALYIYTLTFSIFACGNKPSNPIVINPISDSVKNNNTQKTEEKIFIEDKSKYDLRFIEGLSVYPQNLRLEKNYIKTENEKINFPEILPLNKKLNFTGSTDDYEIAVQITRRNLSNLEYNLVVKDHSNKILDKQSGKAILGSLFFMGTEIDEDSETNEVYEASEYRNDTKECYFVIRVANETDELGRFRANINYACDNYNSNSFSITNCPTLHAE